jgi:tRNA A37 threonylcarbamoyladenosine biosynthesis protein TsaE
METIFSFEPDSYDGFPGYSKELYRHDVLKHIDEKKLRYTFKLPKTYTLSEVELETILKTFGNVWGGREYFVVHDDYVLNPMTMNATKELLTIMVTAVTTMDKAPELKEKLLAAFLPYLKNEIVVNIEWGIPGRQGIQYADIQSTFDEEVFPEAYPYIEDLHGFIRGFLEGKENVLVMLGSPGTGKTRLIKHIIQHISDMRKDSPSVLYSMDEKIFADDSFFFRFLSYGYDALVLEDIDFNLKSRKNGNTFMYKLLGASDGFIRNSTKKIILSTNLPNVTDIDEALLRKGRCYAVLEMKKLTPEQAKVLLAKIKPEYDKPLTKKSYSLADIYNL